MKKGLYASAAIKPAYNKPNNIAAMVSLYFFMRSGAPGRIRTCDHQIRNLMLYPAELLVHLKKAGTDGGT